MKKIIFLLFALSNFFIICIYCQDDITNIEEQIFTLNGRLTSIEKNYFEPEVLKYKIYWEFIFAGEAEIGLCIENIYGTKVYHIITKTSSNPSIDLIYKVRNRTDSYVDFYGFYSLKFVKEQNEAGYYSKDYVLFDYKNKKWVYLLDETSGEMKGFLQDVVSSLYWLRLQDIKVGRKYTTDVWVGKVIYPMIIDVLEIKKIKIFDKEYKCFKVEPKVDINSFPLFKAKGRLFVYITADERKLPVRLESKIFIGRVFADLVEKK